MTETTSHREPFFNYIQREVPPSQYMLCIGDFGGGIADSEEMVIADCGAWIAPEDLAGFEERLRRILILRHRQRNL
jgi:hypothetical protein